MIARGAASDLLTVSRQRTRIVLGVCVAAVGASAAWAFWPAAIAATAIEGGSEFPVQVEVEEAGPEDAASIDLAAFDAPLWRMVEAPPPPPPRPVVQAPPPPPPPLKLQLLGISIQGDQRRAVLYDPDQDRVFIVASGDSVAGRDVESITEDTVHLRDRSGVRMLALKAGRAP